MIKENILQLEKELLKSEIRKSSTKIERLLSKDFIEFGSSGGEYHYKMGDIFQDEEDDTELNWEIISYKIKELSDECILIIYKLIKHDEIDENKKYSLRSSVWKEEDGEWKMIFHQGTCTNKFNI